jgi:aspartyl-tRNA(Asn)/glutamyl-tRNA(Gln) amidotransferase subunit A
VSHQATVVGKTNLDEFGMGSHSTHSYFGPVRNVLGDYSRSVGGSSGGSAVAIAGGQADIALGTDTGGSVRLPAAYTGIVGFKPSYGLVSRRGVIPYANSLDTVGVLALDVRQIRGAFQVLSFHDPRDPTSITKKTRKRFKPEQREPFTKRKLVPKLNSIDPAGGLDASNPPLANLKIGVPVEYNITELSEEVRTAWKTTLRLLEKSGAKIIPISLPNTKHALSAYYIIAPAEAASNLSKYDGVRYGSRSTASDGAGDVLYSQTRGEGFGDEVKRRILLGSYTLSSEAIDNYFIKAQKVRRLVQQDFDRVFSTPNLLRQREQFNLSDIDESVPLENKLGPSQVDFIVCPTAPTIPPLLQEVSKQTSIDTYMNDIFTVPASLAGLPAISIPCSVPDTDQIISSCGSVGMQIIGQFADDFRVLGVASILEKLQREPPGIVRFESFHHHIKKSASDEVYDKPLPSTKVIRTSPGLRIKRVVSSKGIEYPSKKLESSEGEKPLEIQRLESIKAIELLIDKLESRERNTPFEVPRLESSEGDKQLRTTKLTSDKGALSRKADKEIEKELEDSLES